MTEEPRVTDCNDCSVRWSSSLEEDGPKFEPCAKHQSSDDAEVEVLILSQTAFDKDEWKQVVKMFRPDVSDEEYENLWNALRDLSRTSTIHRIK